MNTTYDKLYNDMKKHFTVVDNGCEYTLGEYMLMRANAKKEVSNLPVATQAGAPVLATFVGFVRDKLTVKEPPVKDKTIRAFPLRTSFTTMVSALSICVLVLSCIIANALTGRVAENAPLAAAEAETVEEAEPQEWTAERK